MRISDWSSDVCSSDLISPRFIEIRPVRAAPSVAEMEKENRGRPNMPPPSRSSQAKSRDVGASALELHLPNLALFGFAERSEERRVGKECVSTCRYRW